MKGMRETWIAGNHVIIDEFMIRYMVKAVSYVQYMPAKPIKHGLKVYCLWCAVSTVLLAFDSYVGKENDKIDNSLLAVCDRLVCGAGLTSMCGRVLYTDNYYTSVQLASTCSNSMDG